ncbi:12771_t:CDS:1, partial [Racocetra persica]
LENTYNNSDILLDETFQDYKLYDNLSQANIISEGLTQESTNSLFEESSQASCSYTLIKNSDHESLMSINNQLHSSRSSFDNHKQLQDKVLQQVKKNRQIIYSIMEKQHKTKWSLTLNLDNL